MLQEFLLKMVSVKNIFLLLICAGFVLSFPLSEAAGEKAEKDKPSSELSEAPRTGPTIDLSMIKAVDFTKIGDDAKNSFIAVASDVPCDCGCKTSLLDCLKSEPKCIRAIALAKYILKGIEFKEEPDAIKEAVRLDFRNTYCGLKHDINVKGSYVKGDPKAPVTIVEVSDFECPFCAANHVTLSKIVKKYNGKVKLYFKYYPLKSHPNAEISAKAAEAAGKQKKYWEMIDLLFMNQDFLSEKVIIEMAKVLELDMKKFKKDIKNPDLFKKPMADKKEMLEKGVKSTPQIFFNGMPFLLMRSEEMFSARIDDLLSDYKCCNKNDVKK